MKVKVEIDITKPLLRGTLGEGILAKEELMVVESSKTGTEQEKQPEKQVKGTVMQKVQLALTPKNFFTRVY